MRELNRSHFLYKSTATHTQCAIMRAQACYHAHMCAIMLTQSAILSPQVTLLRHPVAQATYRVAD